MEHEVLYIGIVADFVKKLPHNVHQVGHKYVQAVVDCLAAGETYPAVKAVPVIFPALGERSPIEHWLSLVDGVLLTGAYSNVEPLHYNGPPSEAGTHHDPDRDHTTLPLISRCTAQNIPLLGICRGFQEINVALGGTLHQKVYQQADLMDHREDKQLSLDQQYAPIHDVTLNREGLLFSQLKCGVIKVNSLHEQGVQTLSDQLRSEAIAPDGLIEAFSHKDADKFVLGVQWHPEWQPLQTPSYQAVFSLFQQACLRRKLNVETKR